MVCQPLVMERFERNNFLVNNIKRTLLSGLISPSACGRNCAKMKVDIVSCLVAFRHIESLDATEFALNDKRTNLYAL